MNNQEYFNLYEKARRIKEEIDTESKNLLDNELYEINKLMSEINVLLEKSDIVDKNHYNTENKNEIEIGGFIAFLSTIIKLKNDYLIIEFDKSKNHEKKEFGQIYISKNGFYSKGYIKKSKIWYDYLISNYLNKYPEIKEKLKNQAKTGEDRQKIDDIFEYFKLKEENNKRDSCLFSKEFPSVEFDWFEDLNKSKIKGKLKKINLMSNRVEIELNFNDEGNERSQEETFSFEGNEDWNLTMIYSLKEEFLSFLQETREDLSKNIADYLKAKKRFYEIVEPYLMLNKL